MTATRNAELPNRSAIGGPSGDGPADEFIIGGMTCNHCARHVTEAIHGVPGVASAWVDLERGRAQVRWSSGARRSVEAIATAVGQAGYAATPAPTGTGTELIIRGMTCSGCARRVGEALQGVAGVASADLRLEEGRATVRWRAGAVQNQAALLGAVKQAGYEAELSGAAGPGLERRSWSPLHGWQFNVVVGSILTIPLMALEWGFRVGMERWYHWLALALVFPIQTLCGARFFRGAWNQLKIGSSNMDTLVVLGSTTAFLYSVWGLFAGWSGHLFFMESAAIITLISVGHWIEAKVSARAASSLRALLNLAPPTARLLQSDGSAREVPVAQLRMGERVLLKPGDRVPTDGDVLEGTSAVDESMLTGESMPVEKAPGARVYGGTTNQNGRLVIRVTATGEGTALAQIIAVVERAQNSRANIQKLGDQVSSVFVPIVVLLALGTALWWGLAPESARTVSDWLGLYLWQAHHPEGALAAAIYHAAAVLIIACPCAMGLATPVAIMAGTNVAAERGILIRDGMALEKSGRLTAVIFDKTGTLTEGKLAVVGQENLSRTQPTGLDLAQIAASLAQPSLHPLSQAVARLSSERLAVRDWEERRGSGVQGVLEMAPVPSARGAARVPLAAASPGQRKFRLGSLRWLSAAGVDLSRASEFTKKWSGEGATILGVAAERELVGVLALRDTLKPDAAGVVRQLESQGKQVYLVTGDNQLTAFAIAGQVGIRPENVFAEVRPESKADIVKELQGRGERLAFIGDGINDAPALEQADLGIAVARASDVAREAADIILLKSDIHAVPEALELAQATLRTIKQNLFWAFFYNAAGIPLALFGFMSPVLSAVAMGLSDLIVIGNALRLRRWQADRFEWAEKLNAGRAVGRRSRPSRA